ncbi:MAG: phospho-N-acetylmuramoyl-pentapeptide-transferase [Ignavibacteriales bacterium]
MQYLTACGLSLFISLALGPLAIPVLRRLKLGQRVRTDGPAAHLSKAGTPTMGGLIFLAAMTAAVLAVSPAGLRGGPVPLLLALGVSLGFGAVGFTDDFLKVARGRSLGMRGRDKLFAEIVLGLALGWGAVRAAGVGTYVAIPFFRVIELGPLYVPFVAFMAVSGSNAVNLTDGLDGLAAGSCAISFGAFAVISMLRGNEGMAVFSLAAMGALIGFLRYNLHPARVFMGDTGSLALGCALAAVAALTKAEVLLVLVGGLYVIEAISVIIQVISFQTTGRRLFRMSPLHHHFELAGWPEETVVSRFWAASVVFALLGLAGLAGIRG